MPDIRQSLLELSSFASGIIPTQVSGQDFEPTMQDARDFQTDLILLARRVDKVIEAYGEYLAQHGLIRDDDLKHFRDQVLLALDGNALFCIEETTRERIESLRDELMA